MDSLDDEILADERKMARTIEGSWERVVELSLGRLVRDEQRGVYGMDR